ncbi:DUF1501 domain-containing protein [Paludisphaera mucosa]|uniref:DUF1501 domain-containing protein n=1 Tax=Paludisphaera mucosa TaxID=3030827 RepID=A0ABT6FBQ3_9BACT|nr:DUF1501 domain-containing protein [Paludisphaera mucosa]MDG3005017.1 DUF1501 domain-containing protein [Paludisphaera mucosa]
MNADFRRPISRREAIQQAGTGFGMLGLAALLGEAGLLGGPAAARAGTPGATLNPLAPRAPQFAPKAKRIIHIYLNGGPSQVDTFDPKPLLTKYDGKPLPQGNLSTERKTGAAMGSPFKFRKYGESGLDVSEIFDRTAAHADDLCVIRSMQANTPNHEQSMRLMNCGDERLSRPSMGAWLTYGLGSENENLPGYVSMCPGLPVADVSNWRSAFLPGVFQGTYIDTRKEKAEDLIENIRNAYVSNREQRRQLDLLAEMNRRHLQARAEDDALDARIASFELAYRMQMEATDAFDVSQEPQHVRDMYGPGVQNRQLLIARRLIERGVRFVQLFHGDVQPWDSHDSLPAAHRELGRQCDQGIAALLTDLKQRGLFDDTLVLCGGEFGRTPSVELVGGKPAMGRDHNHWGFSVWLAGGGVKRGHVHGATDDFGYKAVEDVVHVHDLHATILHLLGFDHTKLTYRHAGRDFRLTDVHGKVVDAILA